MATRRTTLIATTGSLVLGATLAIPAFGAPPTYSGPLYCADPNTGDQRDLNTLSGDPRKVVAYWRGYWREVGFCANGSFDASQLTRD
jgi:hypothetical protein